jgi:hypothetical protein
MDPATMGALNAPPIPNVDGIEVQGDVASEEEKEAERQSTMEENSAPVIPSYAPSRVSSRISAVPSVHNPIAYWASYGPPPDGGLQAWLQILAGFSIFFNTWGLIASMYPSESGSEDAQSSGPASSRYMLLTRISLRRLPILLPHPACPAWLVVNHRLDRLALQLHDIFCLLHHGSDLRQRLPAGATIDRNLPACLRIHDDLAGRSALPVHPGSRRLRGTGQWHPLFDLQSYSRTVVGETSGIGKRNRRLRSRCRWHRLSYRLPQIASRCWVPMGRPSFGVHRTLHVAPSEHLPETPYTAGETASLAGLLTLDRLALHSIHVRGTPCSHWPVQHALLPGLVCQAATSLERGYVVLHSTHPQCRQSVRTDYPEYAGRLLGSAECSADSCGHLQSTDLLHDRGTHGSWGYSNGGNLWFL